MSSIAKVSYVFVTLISLIAVWFPSRSLCSAEGDSAAIFRFPRIITRGNRPDLKLLPVGDSITNGFRSSDGNGYRLDLEILLKDSEYTVDFIGSHSSGKNNPDNHHEGFDAYRINGILGRMESDGILLQRPNLVLLHAGTNDNDAQRPGESYLDAPVRLGNLIDFILCQCPGAIVLVAKLIQNNNNQTQTDLFNAQVPDVVEKRYKKGFKIRAVDQSGIGGKLLFDALHPNDEGYQFMAQNWMDAIKDLPYSWLTTALDPQAVGEGVGSAEICAEVTPYSTSTTGPTSTIDPVSCISLSSTVALDTSVHSTSFDGTTKAASTPPAATCGTVVSTTPSGTVTPASGANAVIAMRSVAATACLAAIVASWAL